MKLYASIYICLCVLAPFVQAGKNFDIVEIKLSCHDRLVVPGFDQAMAEIKTYRKEKARRYVIVRLVLKPTSAGFDIMRVWSSDLIAMKGGEGISNPKIWTGLPMGTREALQSILPDEAGRFELPFVFSVPETLEKISLVVEGRAQPVALPAVTEAPEAVQTETPYEVEILSQNIVPEYRQTIIINKYPIVETFAHPAGLLLELQVKVTDKRKNAPGTLNIQELKLKLNGFYVEPINAAPPDTDQVGTQDDFDGLNVPPNKLTLQRLAKVNKAVLVYPVGSHKGHVELTHKSMTLAEIKL